MNWEVATNQQLKNIIQFDKDCPTHLLSGAVIELLNRNLLDGLIHKVVMKRFLNLSIAADVLKMGEEDIFQYCRMKIFESISKYKQGLSSFIYFAFRVVYSELKDLENKEKADKRKTEIQSIDEAVYEYYLPSRTNVEQEVIKKISFEEQISVLNSKEKKTLLMYLNGYCMDEIAEAEHISKSGISRKMKRIIQKLSGREINLKELGMSNYRKGA